MNYILGGGLIGLIAKHILPGEWTVIPFGRSKYYSFNPPLDDNFICCDERLEDVIVSLCAVASHIPKKRVIQRCFSFNGMLSKTYDDVLCRTWLGKIFGRDYPKQAPSYYTSRMLTRIYDLKLTNLYIALLNRYDSHLKENSAKGKLTKISNGQIIWGNQTLPYDRIVSTIPMDALLKLCDMSMNMKYKPCHYIHLESTSIDLEGANQSLVVDPLLSFYKVSQLGGNRYIFYCHEEIPNAGAYFMPILKDYDLIDGTSIPDAIPMSMVDCPILSSMKIQTIGSSASNDWCEDAGSSIIRLLNI